MWNKRISKGWASIVKFARRDARGTTAISVAVLVLVWVSYRCLGRGPASAPAASWSPSLSDIPLVDPITHVPPFGSQAMAEWLKEPRHPLRRNVFALNLEDYPTAVSDNSIGEGRVANDRQDQGLWDDVAKSMSARADHQREQEFRMKSLQRAAAKLSLQQVLAGPVPRAQVNGEWIEEGSFIGSLRVLRIEADGITVEKDGVTLDVPVH